MTNALSWSSKTCNKPENIEKVFGDTPATLQQKDGSHNPKTLEFRKIEYYVLNNKGFIYTQIF